MIPAAHLVHYLDCHPRPINHVAPARPLLQPVEFALSASTGSLLVVVALVTRIYLGWSYVAERLLSAAYPYEETGW